MKRLDPIRLAISAGKSFSMRRESMVELRLARCANDRDRMATCLQRARCFQRIALTYLQMARSAQPDHEPCYPPSEGTFAELLAEYN